LPAAFSPVAFFPPALFRSDLILRRFVRTSRLVAWVGVCTWIVVACIGCGSTREYQATEQLVISDAVDESISKIDFRPMSGRKVYLDTSYLRNVKEAGFVNSDYVTSALRQQIVAAGCLIQDSSQDAELIIEARLGTLGLDNHRVTFGVPENNSFGSASQLIPGSPAIPSIPEIAFAKRESREAAAKVAAFAYDRQTRAPVWQSGVDRSISTARDTWVLGVGPFQNGSIHGTPKLSRSRTLFQKKSDRTSIAKHRTPQPYERPPVKYAAETHFRDGWPSLPGQSRDAIGSPSSRIVVGPEPTWVSPAPRPVVPDAPVADDDDPVSIAEEDFSKQFESIKR
jgi:hypothetical protein